MQVARSLGRTVPLSPQLIFTPTATVATVQPELSTGSPARPPTPAQVRIPGLWEGRGVGSFRGVRDWLQAALGVLAVVGLV